MHKIRVVECVAMACRPYLHAKTTFCPSKIDLTDASSKFAAASFISCKSDEPIATDGASRGARVFPSPLDLGLSPPVGTSNYVQLTKGGWESLTDGSQTKLEDLSVLR